MFRSQKQSFQQPVIIIGTYLQKRIALTFYDKLATKLNHHKPIILSLDSFYQFGVKVNEFSDFIILKNLFRKPWYNRGFILKLLSLPDFTRQIICLTRRHKYFIFFVDTGILERTAITILNLFGCQTLILQDAMKRPHRFANKRSLVWFGGSRADLYLLLGKRYLPMIRSGKTKIVGSPIYNNMFTPLPLGNKILILNQCFACYGEISESLEYNFIHQLIELVSEVGPVELRLHPHNNPELYESLANKNIEVSYKKPMHSSLSEAGIVLAINSSAILEAMAAGRLVFTMDWHPSPFHHTVKNGIIPCKSLEDLRDKLKKWKDVITLPSKLSDNICHELHAQIAYTGEEAVTMITDAIVEVIKQKKVNHEEN